MIWKNRKGAILRIATMELNFLPKNPVTARGDNITETLHIRKDDQFQFCDNPKTLSIRQLKQLTLDIDKQIETLKRVEGLQQKAFKESLKLKK